MDKKIEALQFEQLLAVRKKQLSSFRNLPNKLEIVDDQSEKVVLNNASSVDMESALEAVSAVQKRVVWITETDYEAINFHGILSGILNRLDLIIHVGEHNPFENVGSIAQQRNTLKEAVDLAWERMDGSNYLVYAPAKEPLDSIAERGENFKKTIRAKQK